MEERSRRRSFSPSARRLAGAVSAASAILLSWVSGCGDTHGGTHGAPPTSASAIATGPIFVEVRSNNLATYPCTQCHADRTPDPNERPLKEFHTRVDLVHGNASGWCYRCHTKDDIDKLHLVDGTKVSFDEGYELCGQCHGDKYRDWKDGIHGLTTGQWNGQKYKRSCTACHNPHRPKFTSMTPERPPTRPRPRPEIRPAPQESHEESH